LRNYSGASFDPWSWGVIDGRSWRSGWNPFYASPPSSASRLTAPGLISNVPQHSRGCASSAWARKRPRKKQPDGRKTFRITARTATQSTLSFSLPQISYLTLIDRPFITTYAFIAINVVSASDELLLTQAG